MAQFLRPDSLRGSTSWTAVGAADVVAAVNESTASDTSYIDSGSANIDADFFMSDVTFPPDPGTKTIRYRYRKSASGGNSRDLTVEVYENTTLIQTWSHTGISEVWTAGSQSITNSVTNWNDVFVRFTSGGATGGPGGNRRNVNVSWVEIEVPDGTAPTGLVTKVWTGSAWTTAAVKVWTGSAWVIAQPKVWDGTSWI